MSAAIGFGEYETLLPCDGVNAALTFSRELFSREYVVQRVTSAALAGAAKQNEDQWRGLARIHPGHVVVGVDGVPKDWPSSRFTPIQDDAELQAKLREARTLIWSHELTQAYVVLHALPAGSDPMVCLLAAELEAVRVLVSKDILYCKQAQRAANQAVTWLEGLHELPQSYSSRTQMKLVLAEALFLSSLLRLGGDQRLAAIATARRCAALYVELHEKFFSNPDSASKRDRLLMPKKELRVFQKRVRFGMARGRFG
uniref:BRO1 domain-containing protein n=1 Tax=Phytophthora ramorum TaxID=164328 RepID=H3GKG1_PHYRM